MEKEKDPDRIFKIEKEIAKKYGDKTITSPRSKWTQEKEKEYIQFLKEQFKKQKEEKTSIVEKKGFSIRQNLFIKEKRVCSRCGVYSFDKHDDIYLSKYDVCMKCYYIFLEGREANK